MLGQAIEVDPEGCSYQVLADSSDELLTLYANQLESGVYKVNDDGYIELLDPTRTADWSMPDWLKATDGQEDAETSSLSRPVLNSSRPAVLDVHRRSRV
jgi:hypothetical protein